MKYIDVYFGGFLPISVGCKSNKNTSLSHHENEVYYIALTSFFICCIGFFSFSYIQLNIYHCLCVCDGFHFLLYNNLKNSCDFIGREPWSIRGQTHGITWLVFKMSKIFENSTEFIQIEWIHAIKSININKYLR